MGTGGGAASIATWAGQQVGCCRVLLRGIKRAARGGLLCQCEMHREAVVLTALLLIGGLSTPATSESSKAKRSIASMPDLGALLSPGLVQRVQQEKDDDQEEVQDEKRHSKHHPYSEYLFWLRSGECPDTEEGSPGFFCPTPDTNGQWRCVTEFQLCDHMRDCPNGEDELPTHCLFYSVVNTNYILSFDPNSFLEAD
ncbi:uncharacterized protein LOC132196859 isoform X2 [Neocloeon triangulifer]|uniref:uncharacterized protein LOC132196859 isoform X2 n=1 Tax=Neocloeon triangulifer TaxID=2078957 RepID=UPI00286ED4D9|nr:uncharacterized protein LOC132196859 isoform X2 [Neocloeon triangulifer]